MIRIQKLGRNRYRLETELTVPGGALAHRLFVRRDLERIFTHRLHVLEQRFSQEVPTSSSGDGDPGLRLGA